jgi:N4-gp56 family major capsid protein
MPDTLASLSAQSKQFYERNLLYRARAAQVFYRYGLKTPLPENGGNSVSWRRFNALTLATTPLSEGNTPTTASLSVSEITATVQEFGNFVTVSDALDLMAIDRVMTEASNVLGQNAGESVEAVIRNVLQAGTSVQYATGASRGVQGTGNPITLNLFRKALVTLDANNTHRFNGSVEADTLGMGSYVAFVHPNVVYDIYNDPELKNALQYNNADSKLWTGNIGSIYGIQLFQTTLAPIFAGAGASSANVYGTVIMGQNAFGVVDVAGRGKYEMIVKPLGSSGSDDPLNQRGSIGWKAWQIPVILNNNFMVRIESGATLN